MSNFNTGDIILFCSIGIGIVAIIGIIIIIIATNKKRKKVKVDDEFINQLTTALGGKSNIADAKFVNGRINITLADIEIAQLDTLKKLSTTGVFITNNTIKMLFAEDCETICEELMKGK